MFKEEYELFEIGIDFPNIKCCKDISRDMNLAEQVGMQEIFAQLLANKTGLSKRKIDDVIVTNGEQLCCCYDKEMLDKANEKRLLDSVMLMTVDGNLIIWLPSNGLNDKYYRVL